MRNEPLELLKTKDEWIKLSFILTFLFLLNLSYLFYQYKNLKYEEIYPIKGFIENIYPKEKYNVLKISTQEFTYFTSANKDLAIKKFDFIEANIITTKIDFLSYLKGFYTNTININHDPNIIHHKNHFYKKIENQHTNSNITEIYGALFLATNSNPFLRDTFANYGVSHLVAISGFHLGIISIIIFWISSILYKPIQKRYFPYRNAKADILLITMFVLFSYLYYIDFVASFLRAFMMFALAFYLLRHNIKLISFSTLLLTLLLIITIFPKLLFSLSLWLSISGVFYIFLFIKYFKELNKVVAFLFFNLWIFLVLNPIVHYFFGVTTYEQLLSPIVTIIFTLFYPLSLFLHIIGQGNSFDSLLEIWLLKEVNSIEVFTNVYLFVFYILVSILSIFYRYAFYLLNALFCLFNFYVLVQV